MIASCDLEKFSRVGRDVNVNFYTENVSNQSMLRWIIAVKLLYLSVSDQPSLIMLKTTSKDGTSFCIR